MLATILIVSPDEIARNTKADEIALQVLKTIKLENNPDYFICEDPLSLKISTIRRLQQELSLKPYQNERKVLFIKNAQNLTLPAQHALLKSLEEPPVSTVIILTADKKES